MSAPPHFLLASHTVSLWPAFGLGLAVAVGNGLARFSYALLLPAMRDDLGWSYAQAGWLNTANALGYVIGAIMGYLLLRQFSPSRLFIWGLWLSFISLLVTGLDAGLPWLTTARAVSGIGAAWVFSCGGALIARRYHDSSARRGTATALFFAGAGVGIVLAGVAVNPLLAELGARGWPYAWMALGALSVLLSLWPLREAQRSQGAVNQSSRWALPLRGVTAPLLGYFFFAAGYIVYMTFILAWMQVQGWSLGFSTLVWVVLGVFVSASPFVWRHALERLPAPLMLSASCATSFLGAAIPLIDAGAAGLLISAAVFGLGVFIAPSSVALLVRRHMPADQWAKGMAFFTVIFAVGQAISPVAAGWIGDARSLNDSLIFGLALLLAATLLPLFGLKRERAPALGD